jgi:Flp pilus assembly protein TadD
MDRFVFAKLVLSAAAIGAAALGGREGRLPRAVELVVAVGLGIFLLSCLLSPTPVASLVGRGPRYEGVPVLLTYVGCSWAGGRVLGNRTRAATGALRDTLAVASVVLGLLSVLSAVGWEVEGASVESRNGSVLGNATDQGLVGMMLFAVLFGLAAGRRTPLLVAGAVAAPLTVVLSGSRTALLATFLVLAIHVWFTARDQRSRRIAEIAGGAFVAVCLLALALPQVRDRITEGHSITGRLLLWKESLQVGADRWWLGAPSTFVDKVGRYRDNDWVREVGTSNPPDSPHSWPLQALVAGGVPLLLTAVFLAGLVLVLGWQAVRREQDALTIGLFAATVGYGAALLPNFTIAGSTCLAAFLVGCLVSEAAARKEPRAVAWGAAVAATAGVVVFVMGAGAERALQDGIEDASRGDAPAADADFRRAEHLRPFDGDVAMLAAQTQAGLTDGGVDGAAGRAERWARKSLDRTPDTYASGLALAVVQVHDQRLDEATRTLDRLVRLFPTEPGARIQRGLARFGLGDVDGARADLRRARALDPSNPVPRRLLRKIDELSAGRP